jgi:hypothetical protein
MKNKEFIKLVEELDRTELSYKCYKKGRAAMTAGKDIGQNPYKSGSEEYQHWKNGWEERERELKKKWSK